MRGLVVACFLLPACASPSRYVEKGFDVAEKGLKGIDVGLDLAADVYTEAYDITEKVCRAKLGEHATLEQRDECTKAFRNADDVAAATERASKLYDELVDILHELEPVIQQIVEAAEQVKQ